VTAQLAWRGFPDRGAPRPLQDTLATPAC
jgi:hypothetical protein